MTVEDIIKDVRWCYDEEALNIASFPSATAGDDVLMDNIIKSKISDAVRWICLYAPAELLGGTDEEGHDTGILVDGSVEASDITPVEIGSATVAGRFATSESYIKLARVRVSGWHRAVKDPIMEDSDEYLQLYDPNGATATADRPQAALIEKTVREIEVWPWSSGQSIELTYVSEVGDNSFEVEVTPQGGGEPYTETHYPLPPRVKTSFIYYLAFLTLSAYEDSRAVRMLEIAKMSLSRTENTQNIK